MWRARNKLSIIWIKRYFSDDATLYMGSVEVSDRVDTYVDILLVIVSWKLNPIKSVDQTPYPNACRRFWIVDNFSVIEIKRALIAYYKIQY